jgi:hypothetical protein
MKTLWKLLLTIAVLLSTAGLYGQSFKSGNIIGIHEWKITLNDSITPAQFEKFMLEEYIPSVEKNYTGLKLFLAKKDRGKSKSNYNIIIQYKTIESRNYWFPAPGSKSEKARAANEKLKPLDDKINEMVNAECSYTDWLIL